MSLNFAAAGATSLLIDFDYTILDPKIANGRFYLDIRLTSANGKSAYIYQLVGASSEPFSVSVPFASFLSYESSFDLHHVTQMTIGTGNGNMDGAFAISAIRTNSLVTALAGDYNADGKVDTADYVAWRNEYPQVDSTAAYQNWRANFGAHAAPAAAAVPEPAAATVIIAACICSILCPIVSRQQNPGYKARQSS